MTAPKRRDPIEEAIGALTEAARRTNVVAGRAVPVDFAEIACDVLTSVAANLGGVEVLLAARPLSWEADLIRRIVRSTASDAVLPQWRTEPLSISLDAAAVFDSFGLHALAEDELRGARDRARDQRLSRAARSQARALVRAISELREEDLTAYAQAYGESIRTICLERDIDIDIDLVRLPDFTARREDAEDPFVADLHRLAQERTPLPMTGLVPDWAHGTPADALIATGRTYTVRATTSTSSGSSEDSVWSTISDQQ